MHDTTTATTTTQAPNEVLDQLADLGERFVTWRFEFPNGDDTKKLTKVPYQARPKLRWPPKASHSDPTTWRSFDVAVSDYEQRDHGETYHDGVMCALGCLNDDFHLVGIDLDSCIDAEDGSTARWAEPFLHELYQTYVETSPSGGGVKALFFVKSELINQVLDAFDVATGSWGCKRSIGEAKGEHKPAVEMYTAERFFTFTGWWWTASAAQIATLDLATMRRLGALMPRRATVQPRGVGGSQPGQSSGDNSRSSSAMTIALRMRHANDSYENYVKAVRNNPKTADWCREKGVVNNERELKRTWDQAGDWAKRGNADSSGGDKAHQDDDRELWRPAREVLPLTADGYVNEARLPKREWIGEIFPPKGKVMMMAAPGGTGKSTIVMLECVAVAHHREDLLGLWLDPSDNGVAICLLEDTALDLQKSLAACLKHYKLRAPSRLHLYGNRPDERSHPLVVALRDTDGSVMMVEPLVERIVAKLLRDRIGLLVVDPFGYTHELDENSNSEMKRVLWLWNDVARRANCVVVLLHHYNKSGGEGLGRSRGATSIVDHARGAWGLTCGLTADEAKKLGLTDHHTNYVRFDNPKLNFQPKPTEAIWFHIIEVHLDNGDRVGQGVAVRWYYPEPKVPLSQYMTDELAAAVSAGLGNGEYYTKNKQSKDRWFGIKVKELMDVDNKDAARLIKVWTDAKPPQLVEEEYISPNNRQVRQRLVYVTPQ